MKKRMCIVMITILCFITCVVAYHLTDCATVHSSDEYTSVSFSDSWRIRTVLFACDISLFELACGFTEDYAIYMGGLTYYLAQDDCSTIYIKELDLYFTVSDENYSNLKAILADYKV